MYVPINYGCNCPVEVPGKKLCKIWLYICMYLLITAVIDQLRFLETNFNNLAPHLALVGS